MPNSTGTLADLINQETGGYGLRPDGTPKGRGWFGPLTDMFGNTVTEMTANANVDGHNLQFPLVSPNQSFVDLSTLLQTGKPSNSMFNNAIRFAIQRGMQGKTPYME